jgi:hypothetical protein
LQRVRQPLAQLQQQALRLGPRRLLRVLLEE